jgi:hypothetical protein
MSDFWKELDNPEEVTKFYAEKNGVPFDLARATAKTESNFNPNAQSKAGAQGMFQLMPATSKRLGVKNPFDMHENADAGTKELARLYTKYNGDKAKTAAAYNAGEGRVDKAGGIPDIPETKDYVKKVMSESGGFWSELDNQGGKPNRFGNPEELRAKNEANQEAEAALQGNNISASDFLTRQAPNSLMQYGKDIIGGVGALSPYSFGEGVRVPPAVVGAKRLAVGGLASTLPTEMQAGFQPDVQAFKNVKDFYGERYGGPEKIANTLYHDPFGVLADVSSVASLAGVGLKALPAMGKAAAVAEDISRATAPLNLIKKTAGAMTSPFLEKAAEHLYGAALKPSGTKRVLKTVGSEPIITGQTGKTMSKAEGALEKVKTGIKEDVPLNWAGLQKIHDVIDGINEDIDGYIKGADKQGHFVPANQVVQRLDDLKQQAAKNLLPKNFMDEIDAAKQEFLDAHGQILGMEQAQELKKAGGKTVRNKYGDLSSNQMEIQKTLVRGLKEEIANRIPEITGLNARESRLIALSDDMDKFLVNQVKRPPFKGVSRMAVIFGSVPALAMDLVNMPSFQSYVSLAAHKLAQGQIRSGRGAAALSTVGKLPLSVNAPLPMDVLSPLPAPPAGFEQGQQGQQ